MPLISKAIIFCVVFAGLCNVVMAKPDQECLKHLGGGYGDALCYGNLSADLARNNKKIYENVRAKIPVANSHAKLLDAYMSAQDNALKFCELQRDAGAGWERSLDGSMFPALYGECVYNVRKAQNKFLTDLLEMSKW